MRNNDKHARIVKASVTGNKKRNISKRATREFLNYEYAYLSNASSTRKIT